MRQKKVQGIVLHCPHHGNVPLKRRRGTQSHKWVWYCPRPDCGHMTHRTKKGDQLS